MSDDTITKSLRALADKPVLLIQGKSGSGKTSLACAVLRLLIDDGKHPATGAAFDQARCARFASARVLAPRDWKEAQDPHAHAEANGRGAAGRASILVLDDVGQEAGDGYKANDRSKLIADILADRHDDGARTIVTTFASKTEWQAMYGDGCARRYWDTARVEVVTL
jgi:DNA replication protein DnaC